MTRSISITRRLIIWATVATVLFWIAAVAVSAFVIREELDEVFDSALQETADRLLPLVVEGQLSQDSGSSPRRMRASTVAGESYLTYQLRDRDGRVLMYSHDVQPQPFDAPLQKGFFDSPTHRIYSTDAVSGSLFLQVADPLDHRQEAMAESATALFLPLLLLVPLSIGGIWWIVRRMLAPLDDLRAEIGARDGGNLAPISTVGLPIELQSIRTSVDRLLDRLRTALDSEREFAANSAHELRTPIAGALAQTQRLVRELPNGASRKRAREIEGSLTNLSRLTEKLLQMARADAGIGLSDTETDLVPVVRLVADEFQRTREYSGRLTVDAPPTFSMVRRIDVDAFGIVLRNLIENALIHGSDDRPVTIALSDPGTVTVTNAGPVVAAANLDDLTTRFKRGRTEASGSGLGLSIATSLVERMGGTIQFKSPATGQSDGFEAMMNLPE